MSADTNFAPFNVAPMAGAVGEVQSLNVVDNYSVPPSQVNVIALNALVPGAVPMCHVGQYLSFAFQLRNTGDTADNLWLRITGLGMNYFYITPAVVQPGGATTGHDSADDGFLAVMPNDLYAVTVVVGHGTPAALGDYNFSFGVARKQEIVPGIPDVTLIVVAVGAVAAVGLAYYAFGMKKKRRRHR